MASPGGAAGSKSMPPEPAMPNLDSPRVRAAMRVLGVVPKDLEKKTADQFASELRWDYFERKRRGVIDSVMALHDESPEGASIPDGAEKARLAEEALMATVDANEKKAVEVMNRISRKEVQKTMIKELEAQHQAHISKTKQEEGKARQLAILKSRDKALKEQRKEAEKKLERSQGVKDKAARDARSEAEKLGEELSSKAAAVDVKLQEIADGRVDGVAKSREHRAAAWDRKVAWDQACVKKKEQMYENILQRDGVIQGRIDTIAAIHCNNSAIFAEQLAGCTKRAAEQLKAKQQAKDEGFLKSVEKADKYDNNRHLELKRTIKEYRDKNVKEKKAHEGRYERTLKEIADSIKPSKRLLKTESMGDFSCTGCSTRPEYQHMLESNRSMIDIAAYNRDMLRRSHEYNQKQELARINGMRARANAILASRVRCGQRRMEMIKNCASAKHELGEKVGRARTAPPAKMIQIVADMDPDQEAATRINELLSAMKMDLLPGTKLDDGEDGK